MAGIGAYPLPNERRAIGRDFAVRWNEPEVGRSQDWLESFQSAGLGSASLSEGGGTALGLSLKLPCPHSYAVRAGASADGTDGSIRSVGGPKISSGR
jgi:hypothetical protein